MATLRLPLWPTLHSETNLRTTSGAPYFIFMPVCFTAAAFCFAAFAFICFCAACLCTDFGDLSPIIFLPFGFWFTDPRHVRFSESDKTVSCIAAVVKSQIYHRSFLWSLDCARCVVPTNYEFCQTDGSYHSSLP